MMGGIHFPGMMLVIILAAVVLVALFLAWFFRRPVSSDDIARLPLTRFHPSGDTPLKGTVSTKATNGFTGLDQGAEAERDTYLVVPDISGYTRFLSLNRFSLGHAQHIISELLGALIEGVAPQLVPSKIEGDAILFFGLADEAGDLTGADLGATVASLLRSFYAKREELEQSNLCPCNACKRIGELDLKVFIHRGPVLRYRLRGFYELSGVPVIAVHRLLKNRLSLHRYIMVTEPAFPKCKLPLQIAAASHVEDFEGVGEIASYVYPFETVDLLPTDRSSGAALRTARTKDLAQKLSENARALGRSVGLAR